MKIKIDNLEDGKVERLLGEHHAEMHLYSPPESIHALNSKSLRDPSITFWSAWIENELAGCGALKEVSSIHGEIKSMRTAKKFLRKGVGAKILNSILDEAERRSYTKVSLETGTNEGFLPAIKLYERFGFQECGPFGSYVPDPYSVFYSKPMGRNA